MPDQVRHDEVAMTDLSQFPITRRWPARHPDRLQLYSLNTPNGVKVSLLLEETPPPQAPRRPGWPARHPDRLQLYSLNTPNGVKVSIMLEETGLPYEAHLIDF